MLNRNRALGLLLLCMLALLYLSLYPFGFMRNVQRAIAWRGPKLDSDWVDMGANFLGYAPLGFLGVRVWRRQNRVSVLAATLLAATLSLGIELAQMYLPQRDSNFRDLLFDTAGALTGSLSAVAVRRFHPNLAAPKLPVVTYALMLLWIVWQMFPFLPLLKRYKVSELVAHSRLWDFRGLEFGDICLAALSLYAFIERPGQRRITTVGIAGAVLSIALLGQSLVAGITYSNARVAAATAGLLLAQLTWRPQERAGWSVLAVTLGAWLVFRCVNRVPVLTDVRAFAGEAFLCCALAASAYRVIKTSLTS
jgi:VanZ family protein